MAIADETSEQTTPSKTTLTPLKSDAKDSDQSPPLRTFPHQRNLDRSAVRTAINALIRQHHSTLGGQIGPLTGKMLLEEREAKIQQRESTGKGSTRQDFPLQHNELQDLKWLLRQYPAYFPQFGKGKESTNGGKGDLDDDEDDSEEEEAPVVKTESDYGEDPDMKDDGSDYHTSVGTAIDGGKYITTEIPRSLLVDAFGTGVGSKANVPTVVMRGSLSGQQASKRVWRVVVGGRLQVWPPFGAALEAPNLELSVKRKADKVDTEEGGAAKKARS